jgi:Trypsin
MIPAASRTSLLLALTLTACATVEPEGPVGRSTSAVVDGVKNADDLGFPISRVERGAVLGQVGKVGGKVYQGCSGTLVGDRLVVTAGHCVVRNQDEWLKGAAPLTPVAGLYYASGDDVQSPNCLLAAQAVRLHPDIKPSEASIDHDVALVVLKASALASCKDAVPLQWNAEPLQAGMVGDALLQGGFGSLDDTYDFSPIRHWSKLELASIEQGAAIARDDEQGFPSYGDSGSGALRRFPDGTLRSVGVCSSIVETNPGEPQAMRFVRLDDNTSFFAEVATPELLCGGVPEAGSCHDGAVVKCDARGFVSEDCRADGRDCVARDGEPPRCACACDQNPYCDPDCACDATCAACACDVSAACDPGCACDAPCNQNGDDPKAADGAAGCSTTGNAGAPRSESVLLALGVLSALGARRALRSRRART